MSAQPTRSVPPPPPRAFLVRDRHRGAAVTRGGRRLARAAALALGAVLAFGADEAVAQVCVANPPDGERLLCVQSSGSNPLTLTASGLNTVVTGFDDGVRFHHQGSGTISLDLTDATVTSSDNGMPVSVHGGSSSGDMSVAVTRATLTSTSTDPNPPLRTYGFRAESEGAGRVTVALDRVSISTTGSDVEGLFVQGGGGAVDLDVSGGTISTEGDEAQGVWARQEGAGALDVDIVGGAVVETTGANAHALDASIANAASAATARVAVTGGRLSATGRGAHGVFVAHAGAGAIAIDLAGVAIAATGADAHGVSVDRSGAGPATVTVGADASVTGGLHGVAVRGDGARTVTVNGRVVGGTGAGVHFASGGTLEVGATGRVGAASGVAVRSEGGDLGVTLRAGAGETPVEAAGRIDGAIRADGRRPTFCYAPAGEEATCVGEGGLALGAFDFALRDEGAACTGSASTGRRGRGFTRRCRRFCWV